MDKSQVPKEKPKGCGCGSTAKTNFVNQRELTKQQEKLVERIKTTSQQRLNSVYKTKNRYFA